MSEFLRPRLTGARFEGGAIPLDMLNELPALGEMIVAVAKWRYFQDHPDRKRTPRGFAESASLRLTGVEEGSAIPVIDLASVSPSPSRRPTTPRDTWRIRKVFRRGSRLHHRGYQRRRAR